MQICPRLISKEKNRRIRKRDLFSGKNIFITYQCVVTKKLCTRNDTNYGNSCPFLAYNLLEREGGGTKRVVTSNVVIINIFINSLYIAVLVFFVIDNSCNCKNILGKG